MLCVCVGDVMDVVFSVCIMRRGTVGVRGSKRSLQAGARFTVFCACRPCGPAGWLALLLTKAGDVETNPGPTTLNKKVWICDICRCSCMGSVSVSSCRCVFVSCVHPVAVLNAAFCMTCSLLMLVEDAIGDHTEEAYSRAGLITAL